MFQDASGCSRMLQDGLERSEDVSGCSRVLQDVLGRSGAFRDALGCFRMLWDASGRFGLPNKWIISHFYKHINSVDLRI